MSERSAVAERREQPERDGHHGADGQRVPQWWAEGRGVSAPPAVAGRREPGGPHTPAAPPSRTNWLAVVAIGLAVFMATIDMTIVAIGLPALGQAFNAGPAQTQWVILAYNLPMIALMIPAGRWVDGVNRRTAFLVAVGGFALASALGGVAPSLEVMLGSRALQGVFGAVIGVVVMAMPLAMALTSQVGGQAADRFGARPAAAAGTLL
ncbi:MAG TPA: MFS transporter, partial [Chloroflexota bacterium]|nr:MFS transporter [Chloroflexota bacterium]